jgi:hypothetical protein
VYKLAGREGREFLWAAVRMQPTKAGCRTIQWLVRRVLVVVGCMFAAQSDSVSDDCRPVGELAYRSPGQNAVENELIEDPGPRLLDGELIVGGDFELHLDGEFLAGRWLIQLGKLLVNELERRLQGGDLLRA